MGRIIPYIMEKMYQTTNQYLYTPTFLTMVQLLKFHPKLWAKITPFKLHWNLAPKVNLRLGRGANDEKRGS